MNRRRSLFVLATLLGLGAACGRSRPPRPAEREPAGAAAVYGPDPRVGQYVSSGWGFATSSFWIEGPAGVVLIDAQFLLSAAEEALAAAERATGKRVVAAVVLHANPDKFNGTALLQARGVEVVTSSQVLARIPEIHRKRKAAFYERYAPDYPAEAARPTSFGDATTELHLAGLTLQAHALGPGCSEAHVVVTWEGHAFVGDLVARGAHAWLEIGRTDAWLQRLDEIAALQPRHVHPGRGPSGGPELLAEQRAYLQAVIDLVAAERPRMPVDEAALGRVQAELQRRYPKHRFPVFLELGLPAEWRRQATSSAGDGGP